MQRSKTALDEIKEFLLCETPEKWIQAAIEHQDILLIDHANCEKKAASSAMQLIHRYSENYNLLQKMSRLVREEMRHFEQVTAIMKKRKINYIYVSASRYASELRKLVRKGETTQLVDLLIIGAFIEARSCERFSKIAPWLDETLEKIALEDDYFVEKKLYPNVDFYSGIILKALGIPTEMFTVIFATGRTVGWISHWNEMITNPYRIGRPRQLYTGKDKRKFVPLNILFITNLIEHAQNCFIRTSVSRSP